MGVVEHETRYPATWRSNGTAAKGVLVLGDDGLRLEGRHDGAELVEEIAYSAIERVRVGRLPKDRLDDHRTVIVERAGSPDLVIDPHGLGLLTELADALASLSGMAQAAQYAVVVVPLRKGRAGQARRLLAEGPPFDPEALGLHEHTVSLTEREAVFVFSGPGVRALVERGVRDPSLWRAGLAWRSVIGGTPRIAETVYGWHG